MPLNALIAFVISQMTVKLLIMRNVMLCSSLSRRGVSHPELDPWPRLVVRTIATVIIRCAIVQMDTQVVSQS